MSNPIGQAVQFIASSLRGPNQPQPVYIKPLRQIVGVATAGSSGNATTLTANGATVIQSTVSTQSTTLIADAVIEEVHDDQMAITEHPVEQGAVIADHAYKLPSKLDLTYGWSGGSPQNQSSGAADPQSFLKGIYQQFLGLQVGRVLCNVYTGKRLYENMLIQSLGVTTDKENENILLLRIRFQEIIMATTQAVTIPSQAVQAVPQKTASPVNAGTVSLQSAPQFFNDVGPGQFTGN